MSTEESKEKYLDEKVFSYFDNNVKPYVKPVFNIYDKITRPFIYNHDSLIHRIFLPFAIVFFLYMASVSIKWWFGIFR